MSHSIDRPIHLFVSGTPDLEPEREIIGQTVARLPVSLGWDIARTPRQGEPLQPALDAVAASDIYLFLLGRDIAAPAGVEWDLALRSGKRPLALMKDALRTPAALAFVRETRDRWTLFTDDRELTEIVQAALVQHLLEGALQHGISIVEYEALAALAEGGAAAGGVSEQRLEQLQASGAGGGGVILGPYAMPPGGVPVGEDL